MNAIPVEGRCDARFRAVRDAFERNFIEHRELGAAVCVIVDGDPVVDLAGGWRDEARSHPWAPDTLVNVFSVGKGLASACALLLVDRGVIALDEPLARAWAEMAGEGRDAITLRHVLSHRAGLPAIREPLAPDAMLDWHTMTAALARTVPWWPPGSAHGYHVNTFGFLVGEVVRRAAGCSVGTFLRDEIARPFGADVHVGLPRSEHARVADFVWPRPSTVDGTGPATAPAVPAVALSNEMALLAYSNPAGVSGAGFVNTPEWRAAELPSTNGHATAAGVASAYAGLPRLLSAGILGEATTEHSAGDDLVLGRPSRFGLGFQLPQPERPLGPNAATFGHFGAGGALGFLDPVAGVAFGYVTNEMGPRWQNPRNRGLIDAVFASL
ncbi:MAG TPA: serine hydrolase domain-containing protein [Acidimicrobiales bacterium]|nr:serine hydrolase domain-containing protein [Acidimicrobiales bacterium]